MSMSMSIYAMIWCAGISGNSGDQENLSSGLAVFSEYCTEALGGMAVKTAGNTPAQTGAGRTTAGRLRNHTSHPLPRHHHHPLHQASASARKSQSLLQYRRLLLRLLGPTSRTNHTQGRRKRRNLPRSSYLDRRDIRGRLPISLVCGRAWPEHARE
ncbi:hypothetical protein F5882DRAFT_414248 [Hyaloscypha sp. PMI_1271]|nr:hypothetical protein F5882DRAFT_414248 [Hyaloscypha sp. PMI_1271]